jgi:uncharacterized protein (TIGR03089 family)
MPTPAGPPDLLDAALRRDPARPLLTFYDDASGERAELSVTTFGTWVAKTANLLRDDLAVEAGGGTVALDLPCHWQAAVWLQSAWMLGLHVVPPGGAVDVHVTTYEPTGPPPTGAGEVVALGLGPLALPRRDAEPPAGTTLDYDREVAGHGDRFTASWAVDADSPAVTTGDGTFTGAELAALAAGQEPVAGRALLLAEPLTRVDALLAGLLVPLATDVTAVLCRHLDNLLLPSRVEQEGLAGTVGADTPVVPRWVPIQVRADGKVT